jgi:hypothetical protein
MISTALSETLSKWTVEKTGTKCAFLFRQGKTDAILPLKSSPKAGNFLICKNMK